MAKKQDEKQDLIVTLNIGQLEQVIAEAVHRTLEEKFAPPPPLKVFPIKAAAELLGVYPQTLRVYADQGIVDSFRVGNRYYFTLESLQNFIKKGGSTQPTQLREPEKDRKPRETVSLMQT